MRRIQATKLAVKRAKIHSTTTYRHNVNGWDFGKQASLCPAVKRRVVYDRRRVVDGWDTAQCRTYGRRAAYPGQKVWVVIRDRKNKRYVVASDIIVDAFQFDQPYSSYSLINYWLLRYYGNTGLCPMEGFWFTKAQAAVALSRMLIGYKHSMSLNDFNNYVANKWYEADAVLPEGW